MYAAAGNYAIHTTITGRGVSTAACTVATIDSTASVVVQKRLPLLARSPVPTRLQSLLSRMSDRLTRLLAPAPQAARHRHRERLRLHSRLHSLVRTVRNHYADQRERHGHSLADEFEPESPGNFGGNAER